MVLKDQLKVFLRKLDKHSPRPVLFSFAMTREEIRLFSDTIKRAGAYLEFGIGGSTLVSLINSRASIYSVESDINWINSMREYFIIRHHEKKRLKIFFTDIGQTKEWGYPADNKKMELYPDYSSKVFSYIDPDSLDVVLIDGRFRVACTLKTILECQRNTKMKILIHDFYDRERYKIVLKYLGEISRVNNLGIFKMKPITDITSLEKDYEDSKYDPA